MPAAPRPPPPDGAASAAAVVTRERIQDPVTRHPLLRYRFRGSPTLGPVDPLPAGAWRVLHVSRVDGATVLDLEARAGAVPVVERPSCIDDAMVESILVTLQKVLACGAVHGDLGPHRLWCRGSDVWIEGYGVPWHVGATVSGDVRALAAGLLALAGTRLSPAAVGRLRAVQERGDPSAEATGAASAPTTTVARGTPSPVAPRHVRMIWALATSSLAWVALVAVSWWGPIDPVPRGTAIQRVIDVRVEPAGHAPVSLVVIASPPGSRWAPGAVIGSVPSLVALDRDGAWRFEARFGALRSAPLDLVTPRDRVLVAPMTTAALATAP